MRPQLDPPRHGQRCAGRVQVTAAPEALPAHCRSTNHMLPQRVTAPPTRHAGNAWMAEASPEQLAVQIAVLLLGAALVGMLARRVSVPYGVALALGGLLVEQSHGAAVPK